MNVLPINKRIPFLSNSTGVVCLLYFLFFLIPYSSKAQFITQGVSIQRADRCYMVTPSQNGVYGAVWSTNRIDLSKPQAFEFEIYLGNKEGNGGEGLAFLFHADPRGSSATGSSGAGLGFGSSGGGGAITPSVAIELDTRNNTDISGDIEVDHTTVVYNGEIQTPQFDPVSISPSGANVKDNQCHTYSIEWNPSTQELKLFFDGALRFTHKDNIINKVFNGRTDVYYGFTGSTGDGARNEQSVSFIDPDSRPVAVDDKATTYPGRQVTIPAVENDSHTKGASVSISRIISVEGEGYATILGDKSSVVYTPSAVTEGTFKIVYEIIENIPLSCCPKVTTAVIEVDVRCENYPQPFEISPVGPVNVCEGRAVDLSVPFHRSDATYVWRRNGEVTEGMKSTLTVTESGEYSVEVTTLCGKETSTNKVAVTISPTPAAPVVEDVLQCGFGTVTLKASGGVDGEYRWYSAVEKVPPLPDAVNGTFVTPELDSDTTYFVSIVRNGCESERVPVKVSLREAPSIEKYTKFVIEKGESVELKSAEGNYTYLWSPATGLSSTTIANPVASPSESTTYKVEVTSPSGCVITAEVRVVVREEIVVPNAFSPNGDNINDTWSIPALEGYPGALLEVFDRWGTKVYSKLDYYNEWNGTYNGKPLPRGAYLYVITLQDGRKLTGSVNIVY